MTLGQGILRMSHCPSVHVLTSIAFIHITNIRNRKNINLCLILYYYYVCIMYVHVPGKNIESMCTYIRMCSTYIHGFTQIRTYTVHVHTSNTPFCVVL